MTTRRSPNKAHRLRFHLVFVPTHENAKYRKRVLEGAVAARLRELLTQACEVNTLSQRVGGAGACGAARPRDPNKAFTC